MRDGQSGYKYITDDDDDVGSQRGTGRGVITDDDDVGGQRGTVRGVISL